MDFFITGAFLSLVNRINDLPKLAAALNIHAEYRLAYSYEQRVFCPGKYCRY